MGNPRRWSVLVCNDELNSVAGVAYVLNRVRGLSPDAGLLKALAVEADGNPEVAVFSDRGRAEALAAELQLYGLHVALREA